MARESHARPHDVVRWLVSRELRQHQERRRNQESVQRRFRELFCRGRWRGLAELLKPRQFVDTQWATKCFAPKGLDRVVQAARLRGIAADELGPVGTSHHHSSDLFADVLVDLPRGGADWLVEIAYQQVAHARVGD